MLGIKQVLNKYIVTAIYDEIEEGLWCQGWDDVQDKPPYTHTPTREVHLCRFWHTMCLLSWPWLGAWASQLLKVTSVSNTHIFSCGKLPFSQLSQIPLHGHPNFKREMHRNVSEFPVQVKMLHSAVLFLLFFIVMSFCSGQKCPLKVDSLEELSVFQESKYLEQSFPDSDFGNTHEHFKNSQTLF